MEGGKRPKRLDLPTKTTKPKNIFYEETIIYNLRPAIDNIHDGARRDNEQCLVVV